MHKSVTFFIRMTVTFPALSRPRARTFVWPLVSGYRSNRISQFAFNAIGQHCLEMWEKKSLKRKITTKSLEEKYKALKDIESGKAEKKVATEYNIPLNTLSTWVKSKEKISAAFEHGKSPKTKKLKGAGFDALDKAILVCKCKRAKCSCQRCLAEGESNSLCKRAAD